MNWEQIWSQLQTSLAGNQFLSGGFVLMVLGAAAALLRQWPQRIYYWMITRVFVDLEVGMSDEAFFWIYDWLAIQPYGKERSRSLSVRTCNRQGQRSESGPQAYLGVNGWMKEDDKPMIILTPAPGTHWLLWKRRFLIIKRVREENTGDKQKSAYEPEKERFYISILTRSRAVAMELLEECRELAYPPDDVRVSINVPAGSSSHRHWTESQKRQPRPAGSVVLKQGLWEHLIGDIAQFRRNHHWYIERGIPYRRGYLLHGPPGNGKSSTVLALASELQMDVCVVNLGNTMLGDEELLSMMSHLPDNCILLMEDVDCVFNQREGTKDKDNKLTFSGLLNAIDGVAAPESHVLIMTTNHPERLDPALIRPGRCDVKVLIENATREQAHRLFLRFFPNEHDKATKFADQVQDGVHCMAALQGHLVRNAHNAQDAVVFEPVQEETNVEATAGETGEAEPTNHAA